MEGTGNIFSFDNDADGVFLDLEATDQDGSRAERDPGRFTFAETLAVNGVAFHAFRGDFSQADWG